jgi:hypothetical protein
MGNQSDLLPKDFKIRRNTMKKVTCFSSLIIIAVLCSAAMATDFHALSPLQAVPVPVQDKELSTIEGGADCSGSTIGIGSGGVALCAWVLPGSGGGNASFTVANEIPVTGAPFLQTVE